ncbi:MAG: methyltransferase domain-containing protein [Acidobacteriota bacterium]
MREDLIDILCCPESREPLRLAAVDSFFRLDADGPRFVVRGILSTASGVRYPVLDEIARLVPGALFSDAEKAALDAASGDAPADPWAAAREVEPEVVTGEDLEAEIRRRMLAQYALAGDPSGDSETEARARRRCEGEIRYMTAEARGSNKRKYVGLLRPHIDPGGPAESILETGGNFPGLTRNLSTVYRPARAVVANIQILFPKAFLTPRREIQAVRADVQALPFIDRGFDLVVTAFMLEHVPDWRRGLRSLMRVGERVFVAFGPNKWFPFEVGHLDAPLAGTLPKPIAARVTWLWLFLIGKPRPLRRLQEILQEVFHVGSGAFARQVIRFGGRPHNLFPELIQGIVADADAPSTGPRRLLKTYPTVASAAAKALTALGLEPQMYYWIKK